MASDLNVRKTGLKVGIQFFCLNMCEKSVIYKAEISHMTKLWIFSQIGDDRAEAFL